MEDGRTVHSDVLQARVGERQSSRTIRPRSGMVTPKASTLCLRTTELQNRRLRSMPAEYR